ncbi:hypothetical protein KDN24_06980 [Bacillus sp. Bva_UNVM-123]|uniref:hypothetical protein n=1 Tax=Bacillus sp. Bva_UNVM-123 TaxID=2829798 RepID=UPI00391F9832
MSNLESRESYVERELNNWKESYIVKPEQDFLLRSMFELQFQFKVTPDEHVKAKRDLIYTIQGIMSSLKLVPALNKDRFKVLVIVGSDHKQVRVFQMFQKMFVDRIPLNEIQVSGNGKIRVPVINTKEFEIRIENDNINLLRGLRADYILNLSGNTEVDEYFRNMNQL